MHKEMLSIVLHGGSASPSTKQLLHSQAFTLHFTQHVTGELRYSLDGSWPNLPYTQPILITTHSLVRWGVFREDQLIGTLAQQEFFFREQLNLPVVSIITNPENLFDPTIGIMVQGERENHLQDGKKWERSALLRYFNQSGTLLLTHHVGLRLHGRAQRSMPQQSFRLIFQDEAGRDTWLRYPILGETGNRQYRSLVLRNGGLDARSAMLHEQVASQIITRSGSTVGVAIGQPVIVLLNGQYWGIYYLQERFDEGYFEERFHVPETGLAIVEVPLDNSENRGDVIAASDHTKSSVTRYNQLLAQARNCVGCLSIGEAWKTMDVNNLRDYLLFQLFFANGDWPFNNAKAWRHQPLSQAEQNQDVIPELDGRFRWLLFDQDVGLGYGLRDEATAMERAAVTPYNKFIDNRFPFRNFFYQDDFRNSYLRRVDKLAQTGLNPDSLAAIVDEAAAAIAGEMPHHISRWKDYPFLDGAAVPTSMDEWQNHVAALRQFLVSRAVNFPLLTVEFFRENYHQ
jgi:hypothetical protein